MDTTQKYLILPCNKAEAPTDFAMHVKFAPQMSVGVIHYDDQIEANKKMIDFILEYFKKEYKIYTKDISSHNDTLIDMMYSIEKKNDNFKIIMEEY